ncbi:MAG: hypothetical protein U1F25_13495 [Rubrivivax sp.]
MGGPRRRRRLWAQADKWPSKPIRYIVPFAAGGTTDILARVVGEKLGPRSARPSSSTTSRARAAWPAPANWRAPHPDGYTIGGGTISSHAINATLYAGRLLA